MAWHLAWRHKGPTMEEAAELVSSCHFTDARSHAELFPSHAWHILLKIVKDYLRKEVISGYWLYKGTNSESTKKGLIWHFVHLWLR